MNEKQYQTVLSWCRKSKKREAVFTFLCKTSPISVIIIYGCTCLYLLATKDARLIKFLCYPALDLILVTLLRKWLNQPRPQEVYSIKPLIKHHNGESFPSRHTASATIIAFSCYWIFPPLGILCFLISIYVGLSRIIGGVHFVKDVLAGAGISILLGSCLLLL